MNLNMGKGEYKKLWMWVFKLILIFQIIRIISGADESDLTDFVCWYNCILSSYMRCALFMHDSTPHQLFLSITLSNAMQHNQYYIALLFQLWKSLQQFCKGAFDDVAWISVLTYYKMWKLYRYLWIRQLDVAFIVCSNLVVIADMSHNATSSRNVVWVPS